MPFTFSHPAAVLPISAACQKRFPLSALIVGSMAPDFEYFLRISATARHGNTMLGQLYFCLPVSLVILWLFHRVLKCPAMLLLPDAHRLRLEGRGKGRFRFGPPVHFAAICTAILLGSATHLFWDGFTHWYGWAVRQFPTLKTTLFTVGRYDIQVYRALQHISTLGGLAVLLWVYGRWYVRQPKPVSRPGRSMPVRVRAAVIVAIAAAGAAAGGVSANAIWLQDHDVRYTLVRFVVAFISATFLVATIYAAVIQTCWMRLWKGK